MEFDAAEARRFQGMCGGLFGGFGDLVLEEAEGCLGGVHTDKIPQDGISPLGRGLTFRRY